MLYRASGRTAIPLTTEARSCSCVAPNCANAPRAMAARASPLTTGGQASPPRLAWQPSAQPGASAPLPQELCWEAAPKGPAKKLSAEGPGVPHHLPRARGWRG
eukprot:13335650-Alexandrium_andersonii.AAC.1